MTVPTTAPVLTVFYDGSCPLCAAEIGFYQRRRGAERIAWIDASACPDAVIAPGLTRDEALRRFQVCDAAGQRSSGGRAFAKLWTALPEFSWLGGLFSRKALAWILDRFYDLFLRWRPQLQALARQRCSRPPAVTSRD